MEELNKFDRQHQALEKVITKITILQILAILLSCGIGMYLTTKKLYFECIYVVPFHMIIIYLIVKLNERWCDKIKYIE
jgi:hypothetical protein